MILILAGWRSFGGIYPELNQAQLISDVASFHFTHSLLELRIAVVSER